MFVTLRIPGNRTFSEDLAPLVREESRVSLPPVSNAVRSNRLTRARRLVPDGQPILQGGELADRRAASLFCFCEAPDHGREPTRTE